MALLCSLIVICLLSLLVNGSHESVAEKLVICNYMPFSIKRPGTDVLNLDDIDPTLCTHFIYLGATIDESTHNIIMNSKEYPLAEEEINGQLNKTMSLRERNPHLKILLGTCCINKETFGNITLNEEIISKLKKNIVHTLRNYGFDGLFISGDELPDYHLLASALRQEFDKHGFILAKFFFPPPPGSEGSHLPYDLAESHDLLIIASYWNMGLIGTGMVSSPLTLERRVNGYLERGIPPKKLIVAIPAFFPSYILCDRNESEVSAKICGIGNEGTSEAPKSIMLYYELMRKINNASEGWMVRRDNETGMMYGHSNSNLWASYEDPVSVRAKGQFIIEKNLGGGIILSIDGDDFAGYNEEGIKFPLTKALYESLRGN